MTNRTLPSRFLAALVMVAALATACGEEVDLATAPDPTDTMDIVIPPTLAGLTAKVSEKATKKLRKEAQTGSYARQVTVYELRQGKELRAAIEVLRLAPDARVEDPEFRREVVRLIGGSDTPPENRNGTAVYRLKLNEQHLFVWFESRFLQILSVRASVTEAGQAIGVNVEQLLNETLALAPTQVA